MAILFSNLWPTVEEFSLALVNQGFEPLSGELRIWWIIFRNVQADLQINARTLNKAKFLCIQEWVILANTYTTAKEFYKTSVADLIKQKMTVSFASYSAAQPLVVDEKTKEYLIGKNINENDIQRGLIQFINSLDLHFYNLARISPMSKLLREYRQRIGVIMPYEDDAIEGVEPKYGDLPITVGAEGNIGINIDIKSLYVNEEGQLAARETEILDFEYPLAETSKETISLLYDENIFKLNDLHQLTIKAFQTPLTFSYPLLNTNEDISVMLDPNTLKINSQGGLEVISNIYNYPLIKEDQTISLSIDPNTLKINDLNQLEVTSGNYTFRSPIYNRNGELNFYYHSPLILDSVGYLTLGYASPFSVQNDQLKLVIDPSTLEINSFNQLTVISSLGTYNFLEPLELFDAQTKRVRLNVSPDKGLMIYNNGLGCKIDNRTIYFSNNGRLSARINLTNPLPTFNIPLSYSSYYNSIELIIQYGSSLYTSSSSSGFRGLGFAFDKGFKTYIPNRPRLNLQGPFPKENGSYKNSIFYFALNLDETKLGYTSDNKLTVLDSGGTTYTFNEPLRVTNNTEVSIGYEDPLYETTEHNLGIKHGSPLYLNPQNQLTLNYTPVFKLNAQQQLDLSIAKPLILDSNHDLTLDYTGGLTMLNSKLQLNLVVGGPLNINNRQELALDIATNGALAQGDSLYVKTDTTTIGINSNNQLTLSSSFQDKITQIQTEVSNLIHETRELTQINNRLTRLEEETINYTIYKQGTYKFRNKIQSGNSRFDNILENIPTHLKIVNIKGRFIIQHNYGSYLFASFHLDQLQDFSFSTHPNNQYYANYITYFKQTISNPVILRLYRDRDTLKYNVNSGNITSQQGYNIFLEYQILIKDTEEQVRNTWNLIKGQAYLLPTPWLYYFPKFLILKSTTTISFSWTYQNTRYTSGNVSTSYGIPISLYLNNRSGKKWSIKIKDANSFVITCASMVMIQDLAINVTN